VGGQLVARLLVKQLRTREPGFEGIGGHGRVWVAGR
jgi:hypothetical protein